MEMVPFLYSSDILLDSLFLPTRKMEISRGRRKEKVNNKNNNAKKLIKNIVKIEKENKNSIKKKIMWQKMIVYCFSEFTPLQTKPIGS